MKQLRSNLDIIVSLRAARASGDSLGDFSPVCFSLCFLSFAFLRFFSSLILLRALSLSFAFSPLSDAGVVEIGSSPRYRSLRKCRNLLSETEIRIRGWRPCQWREKIIPRNNPTNDGKFRQILSARLGMSLVERVVEIKGKFESERKL